MEFLFGVMLSSVVFVGACLLYHRVLRDEGGLVLSCESIAAQNIAIQLFSCAGEKPLKIPGCWIPAVNSQGKVVVDRVLMDRGTILNYTDLEFRKLHGIENVVAARVFVVGGLLRKGDPICLARNFATQLEHHWHRSVRVIENPDESLAEGNMAFVITDIFHEGKVMLVLRVHKFRMGQKPKPLAERDSYYGFKTVV